MSLALVKIIKELEGIVKDFHDSLVYELNVYHTSTPETIRALRLESINQNIHLWGRLSNVILRAATAISVPTRESDGEAMTRMMTDGIVKYLETARLTAFSERCRGLLPPSKVEFNKVSRLCLHEMVFLSSDCFSELSNIHPGSHGWVFVFRTDLKEWLLKTIDPFTMTYQNPNGQKSVFGVYKAIQFFEGNMTGLEFARLSESTQNIIIAQASKDVQREDYDVVRKAFLASHLTISCFLLQCREMAAPSSIFAQGRSSTLNTAIAGFPQNPPKPETTQVGCQMEGIQLSHYSAPFHAFPSSESRGNVTAPVVQADCDLQAKSNLGANPATQPNVAGSNSIPNMSGNVSHVPVPGPMSNEHGWYNEAGFYKGYPPAAHQNHPSKNHHQDQIQFREPQEPLPPRLRTVDGKQSASYGIPLHISTNTRGPALGYTAQHALQLPTSQVPSNNYQRSDGDNRNQNQNVPPAWTNSGFLRAPAGGAHTSGYQRQSLVQPFASPSLVVRPQLPVTQVHDFRLRATHLPEH